MGSPRARPSSAQVNIDRLFHPQDESAWILHSPLYVGYREVDGQAPMVRGEFNLRRSCDLVLGAKDSEHAVHLHCSTISVKTQKVCQPRHDSVGNNT